MAQIIERKTHEFFWIHRSDAEHELWVKYTTIDPRRTSTTVEERHRGREAELKSILERILESHGGKGSYSIYRI